MLSTQVANDPDTALNENQAAELLGFSVRTLQSWRMQGGGPRYVKVGRFESATRGVSSSPSRNPKLSPPQPRPR